MTSKAPSSGAILRGNTRVCAVVTSDASYSLSPELHNAGYRALGLDYVYLRHSVEASELGDVMRGVRALASYRGLSIGTPHKLAVMSYLDDVDNVARQIGAVNTVVIEREAGGSVRLLGTNTDWYGIETALKTKLPELRGAKVAIIGASGAARAAIYTMQRNEVQLKVFNRDDEYLAALRQDSPNIDTGSLDDLAELRQYEVVVHATPVGMRPGDPTILIPDESLRAGQVVFDCVYSALIDKTSLVERAERLGAKVVQGREMFFWQATQQFRLFTGQNPPVEAMRAALAA